MALVGQLLRFEALLAERFPGMLSGFEPGLDDAGIERMRAAVAPLHLTPEIETLYRWRNGGPAVFAGWRQLPADRVLRDLDYYRDLLSEPPAWLRIFGDQIIAFVELGVPGTVADSSLWSGHTHDVPLDRIADSLEAFVASCADALDDGSLGEQNGRLLLDGGFGAGERPFTVHRLSHSPRASTLHGETAPNRVPRHVDRSWPAPWLVSLGLDGSRLAPRGRTHTITELDGSPVGTVATLVGTVAVLGFVGRVLHTVLTDGSTELRLDIDLDVTVLTPDHDGGLNEIDISLGTAPAAASGVEVLAVRPLPRVREDGA